MIFPKNDLYIQQRAKQTDFLPSYDVKLVVFKRMWRLLNCCHALGMYTGGHISPYGKFSAKVFCHFRQLPKIFYIQMIHH